MCLPFRGMEDKVDLTLEDWALLRKLARENALSIGGDLLKKIKAGHRRWTEDLAIEIHVVTSGSIPCWVLRPDLWAPGQIPPAVHASLPEAS